MKSSRHWLRVLVRGVLSLALRIYYRSIQVQGRELVPEQGPVLLVANHPNSLLDPAILVHLLPRTIRFGAKHTLFSGPLKSILDAFGAIPLVRAQDDRRAMRRNLAALDRYASLLGQHHMTAIFPEGVSQDDPHLAPIKTGAARIAFKAESAAEFRLGLQVLPVGLQFEPRRRFRADAFVRFGKPFGISDLAASYAENHRQAVRGLTSRINDNLKTLSFHVESVEEVPFVERIVEVYLYRIRKIGLTGVNRKGIRGELLQKVADCLNHYAVVDPPAVAQIERLLRRYERLREKAGVSRRLLEEPSGLLPGPLAPIQAALEVILGLLPALFGVFTGALPYCVTKTVARYVTRRQKHLPALSFTHILAGSIAFPLAYGLQIWWVLQGFSELATIAFAVTLVPSGLFALFYVHRLRKLAVHLGGRAASWMKLSAVARVADARDELLAGLDRMRDRYRVEVLGWAPLSPPRLFRRVGPRTE